MLYVFVLPSIIRMAAAQALQSSNLDKKDQDFPKRRLPRLSILLCGDHEPNRLAKYAADTKGKKAMYANL
jgi:hypothetical protein